MGYKYKITDKAEEDLDEIIFYISKKLLNSKAASKFLLDFRKSIEKISDFPEMCPLSKNKYVLNEDVRKLRVNNYTVYYIPNHKLETNIILRIIYSKSDTKLLF
ncbi:type II toxin-antitoxin system RelE/ParE family toxin [Oceanivirga miroungae]|uniref:Plasmid stabilization system n=1 Tax=Oceanivirga miroungae TaxID=1130046 RepID=A0A6I8M6L0_9FUSO|nr:type II toxin-antitoxin system RelE/ParE family toxin [Oceanivirga miroungae]VWL85014.1 plasmid stabilization system [Oceanivirga miroungae]